MNDDLNPALGAVLSREDLGSHCWRELVKHAEAKLNRLHLKNENDLDPVATAHVRGQIKAWKDLLALGNPSPAMVADEGQPE
jgi:hypothetical protein